MSIKELAGGKSTLQNEILGDLGKEFPSYSPSDKIEENELRVVATSVQPSFQGKMGPYTGGLLSRMVGAKMPPGLTLSKIREYLTQTYGLGPERSAGALVHAITMEPASRLGSEGTAHAWLDQVVASYGAYAGVSIAKGGGSTAAPIAGAPVAAPSTAPAPADLPERTVSALDFVQVLSAPCCSPLLLSRSLSYRRALQVPYLVSCLVVPLPPLFPCLSCSRSLPPALCL